jgi:hypothetical protein
VSVILSKKVYMYMCPIPNCFRDRAISLYRTLDLAPKIVLCALRTEPLYEACELEQSVRWLLYVDTRDELLDLVMDVIASIKEHQDAHKRATCHSLTRVAKCIDVAG